MEEVLVGRVGPAKVAGRDRLRLSARNALHTSSAEPHFGVAALANAQFCLLTGRTPTPDHAALSRLRRVAADLHEWQAPSNGR